MLTALAAAGARPEHVVKWTIYFLQGQSPQVAFESIRQVWDQPSHPPTISVVQVAGLAHPEFLLEVAAIAAVSRPVSVEEIGALETLADPPPFQRNDYLGWITRAVKEETRQKRLAQMIDELERGDVYMNMAWGRTGKHE